MFDHVHYVPVLKGKRGEIGALADMGSWDGLTPLIEAVPGKAGPQEAAISIPKGLAPFWPTAKPYFADLRYLEDVEDEEETPHPVTLCAARAATENQSIILTTSLAVSPAYQLAVRDAGLPEVALRLVPDDFAEPDELAAAVDALLQVLGATPDRVHLMVDLGSVAGMAATGVALMQRGYLDLVPQVEAWRTLTIISGAFPPGLAALDGNEWSRVPRADWIAWRQLVAGARPPARLPAFGDYAIAHPNLPPDGPVTILASMRYSTPGSFMIFKGRNVRTDPDGYNQFVTICADLIGRQEFSGQGFSAGDAAIQQKATTPGSAPGNPEQWRRIGTNHHVEMVRDQLANLPAP